LADLGQVERLERAIGYCAGARNPDLNPRYPEVEADQSGTLPLVCRKNLKLHFI